MPDLLIPAQRRVEHVLLCPAGSLCHDTACRLHNAITAGLADTGRVVVDLDGLRIEARSRTLVFPTALDQVGGWPRARLALCGGSPDVVDQLRKLRVTRLVPHAATLAAAVDLLEIRPPLVRRAVTLRPRPEDVHQVRTMIDEAGRSWDLAADTVETARLVLTEMATNAVLHAQTTSLVLIEYTGTQLRLIVADRSAHPPQQRPHDLYAEHGRGLHLIGALTHRSGVAHHGRHKEAWAVIHLGPSAMRLPWWGKAQPHEDEA